MKLYQKILILLSLFFTCNYSFGNIKEIAADTIRYKNGVRKEAITNSGNFVVSRKLYNKKGILIEEHNFQGGGRSGVLKSYYNDTTVASVVQVAQRMKEKRGKKKYQILIKAGSKTIGYHEGTDEIAYTFVLNKDVELKSKNHKRYNCFYNDIFLLYKTRRQKGLNATITFFDKLGRKTAVGELKNGKAEGIWKEYYSNSQLKSEGKKTTIRTSEHRVGKWFFYTEKGIIEKELEYYDGKKSNTYISIGALINKGIYKNDDGDTLMIIEYPRIEDYRLRTDTIKIFYKKNKLKQQFDTTKFLPVEGVKEKQLYKYSAKYTEFYTNGNLKAIGFIAKPPRRQIPQDDLEAEKFEATKTCIEGNTRKIGYWYYFKEDGTLHKVVEYKICGGISKELPQKKVIRINKKYNGKSNYDFDFLIKL